MRKLPLLLSLATLAAIFFLFAMLSPLMADNYIFSRAISPGFASFYSGSSIAMEPMTVADAFRQAGDLYRTWCGRYFGNLSVYLLFMLPKAFYALFSACLFAFYVWLLTLCIFGRLWRQKLTCGWLFGIGALLWLSIPSFGEAFFWLSVGGQLALLAQALVFVPFRFAFDDARSPGLLWCMAFFFFCIAATSLDFASSAALPPTAIACVCFLRFHDRISLARLKGLVWGSLGLCTGGALTLLAPGNAHRLLLTQDSSVRNWLEAGWSERVLDWLSRLPEAALTQAIPLVWLLWALYVLKKQHGKNWLRYFPQAALIFLGAALLTHAAYLFTAWPPSRAFATCAAQLLICAAIVSNAALASKPAAALRQYHSGIKVVCLLAILTVIHEAFQFWQLHQEVANREELLKSKQEKTVYLPPLRTTANRWQPLGGSLNDISEDPDFWINRAMASWYGIEKIIKRNPDAPEEYECEFDGVSQSRQLDPRYANLAVRIAKNRLAISIPRPTEVHFSGKLSFYYDGYPGILARLPLWPGKMLREQAGKKALNEYLLPLLMARVDMNADKISNSRTELLSYPLNMAEKEILWLQNPDRNIFSADLIPLVCRPRREAGTDQPPS